MELVKRIEEAWSNGRNQSYLDEKLNFLYSDKTGRYEDLKFSSCLTVRNAGILFGNLNDQLIKETNQKRQGLPDPKGLVEGMAYLCGSASFKIPRTKAAKGVRIVGRWLYDFAIGALKGPVYFHALPTGARRLEEVRPSHVTFENISRYCTTKEADYLKRSYASISRQQVTGLITSFATLTAYLLITFGGDQTSGFEYKNPEIFLIPLVTNVCSLVYETYRNR